MALAMPLSGCDAKEPPTAHRHPAHGPDDAVLDRAGVVTLFGRQHFTDEQVADGFAEARAQRPREPVLLRAHRATLHGRLVRVTDLAKEAQLPLHIVVYD